MPKLPDDDLIAKVTSWAKDMIAEMPRSRDLFPPDVLRQWLASRKEIAKTIDLVACEIGWWGVNEADPYGIRALLLDADPDPDELERLENSSSGSIDVFVRSPDSNGWVYAFDLSNDKHEIVYARARAISKSKRKVPHCEIASHIVQRQLDHSAWPEYIRRNIRNGNPTSET